MHKPKHDTDTLVTPLLDPNEAIIASQAAVDLVTTVGKLIAGAAARSVEVIIQNETPDSISQWS